MTMPAGRCRDIAHVSAVELRTQVPEMTVDFFVRLMGLSEVAREGDRVWLRTWDDYERFTVCVVDAPASGIGRTWLRAAGPEALARRVAAIEAAGYGVGWTDGEQGIGPAYRFRDPDGHEMGMYWETEWYGPRRRGSARAEEPGLALPGPRRLRAAARSCELPGRGHPGGDPVPARRARRPADRADRHG